MARLATATAVLLLLGCASPALATFPGKNGKLFFSSNRADPYSSYNFPSPKFDTYRMNPDGTAAVRLTGASTWPFDHYDDGRPAVSPNGKRVALVVVNSTYVVMYVIDRDGSNQLWYGEGLDPAWSPDGSQIAYTSRSWAAGVQLTVMDADGSHRHLVSLDRNAEQTQPDWSPDGKRIAFVRRVGSGNSQIATIRPDGTGLQVLTGLTGAAAASDPSWSPDGNVIAFSRYSSNSLAQIALVNADGSASATVTSGAYDTRPAWAPNGKRIAFASNRATGVQIFTMNPNGTGLVQVTRAPEGDVNGAVGNREPFWDSQHPAG